MNVLMKSHLMNIMKKKNKIKLMNYILPSRIKKVIGIGVKVKI